jgi:hypothetical protein
LINGRLYGNTTPNYSMLLPPGNYRITVRKNGYVDYNSTIVLSAAGVTLQVNLVQPGAASAPAMVPQGVVPNAMPNAATPRNAIPMPNTVPAPDISQNNNRRPVPQIFNYALTVAANVNGADIFINGNPAGKAPFSTQIPNGSYTILVRAPGFVDYNQNFVVNGGPVQVNAMLQGLSYQVSVNANVNGALVFINGAQMGQTPYAASMPQGNYTVLVRATGYTDYQVQIAVNGPQAVNAALQPMIATWQLKLPENYGNRDRDAKPGRFTEVQFWVDGVLQDQPQGRMAESGQIMPGRHLIRFISGGLVAETQVDIQAGGEYIFEPFIGINVK